jgi:trigger factor
MQIKVRRFFMKKNKVIIFGMCMVLAISALAGCNSTSSSSTTAAGETVAEGETSADSSGANTETTVAEETLPQPDNYGSVTTLADYIAIDLEVLSTEVTDEQIQSEIDALVESYPLSEEVDRAAASGDVVNIDFVGTVDGEEFDGGSATAYDLELGSGSFIDDFEDQLVGLKKGDTKDVNVTFPEDYGVDELNGKDAVFACTINGVYEQVAEFTDAWATWFDGEYLGEGITTTDGFRTYVREYLESSAKTTSENQSYTDTLNYLIENSVFEMSDEAIEYEKQELITSLESELSYYGMTLDDYYENYQSQEELEADVQAQAEMTVQQTILTRVISEKEGMELGDDDYQYIVEVAGASSLEELQDYYAQEELDIIALNYKVMKFIVDNANVTIVTELSE